MSARESLREVENLRFRFQMNNRLRLECLAAVSKVFREFHEPISDELLSAFVFALPQELLSGRAGSFASIEQSSALAFEHMGKPGLPPNKPGGPDKDKPEKPDKPKEKPAPLPPESPAYLPPESPAYLPPESPTQPGLPPEQPSQVASEYLA
ncbi:MAG: hypothetical protein ABI596_14375 [Pyrinomonadaceae bacterium]